VTISQPDELAPYAVRQSDGAQRLVDEPETTGRGPFRRDRDRIVHAQAFRRLAHKTQVFISEEGDHYRTRLTHTIEVAQIARSLARNLLLDSDLTEALALAHDLGHTPFGHTGEDALAETMASYGGFEHNAQTLRIVTKLERRYAAFDGLNLTLETLGGIIKHNGPLHDATGAALPFALNDFLAASGLSDEVLALDQHGSLEAQIAAISDDIAYNTHDIDDGVRAGLFALDDLRHVPLVRDVLTEIDTAYPGLSSGRRMGEFTRRLAEDVWMIKAFLFKTVYRNADMMALRAKADQVLRDLFGYFLANPDRMPTDWRWTPEHTANEAAVARSVCDFVAGMTDRYALNMHARLFDDTPDLRYGAAI